ncbi:class I SAM-dependent methyltransferase [Lysinibacillus sphaericus]
MKWKFNNTSFLADTAPELPANFMKNGPWSGHRQFAYDLVQSLKPETIVELGTHYGTSFFSFCQAVKDAGLASKCYAVDTWKGDPHAGYYGEGVYQAVKAVNSRDFPHIGELIRSTFDEAVSLFEDESIDLLHIDGYHTYEAVSHDYQTWIGKLKKGAPVLFHDTAVTIKDYNVHGFWKEQSEKFPSIHFSHCNGLGVLFPKGVPASLESALKEKEKLIEYYEKC